MKDNMIKKYIKTETLNIGGKEVTVQFLVVEVDGKIEEVNDVNEILNYCRANYSKKFYMHRETYQDFDLLSKDGILMLLLLDNKEVGYKNYFINNFRGIIRDRF